MVFYKREAINIEVINMIAHGISQYWRERKNDAIDNIDKSLNETKREKKVNEIKSCHARMKREDEILILADRLKDLEKIVNDTVKIDELYQLVVDTENKKAIRTIGKHLESNRDEIIDRKYEAQEILESGKVSRPVTISEDVYYVGMDKNGFYIGKEQTEYGDAYAKVFETAFLNEAERAWSHRPKIGKKAEKKTQYVKSEMEELDSVEKYWNSEGFKGYINKLEKENTKEVQKYKSAQIKKVQAVWKLRQIYQELGETKLSIEKVQLALNKLKSEESCLFTGTFKKSKKSLLAQTKRQTRKEEKILKTKQAIFDKRAMVLSVNNSKEYEKKTLELEEIEREEVLKSNLKKLRNNLIQGIRELYERERYSGSKLEDKDAIRNIEERITKLKGEIRKEEMQIEETKEKKKILENDIKSLFINEVETTIKGQKADPVALPSGITTDAHKKNVESYVAKGNEAEARKKLRKLKEWQRALWIK